MSRIIYTLIIFFSVISLFAQYHPSCNGQRYRVDVFENVKVTKDIEYSEATTIGGESKKLFLDVYEPVSDVVTERPVIVLAFGGSFISGTRSDIQFLCERFAKKGYVAVSIDYRLYDLPLFPLPTETEMQDVVVRAVKDMKSALRYLDNDAKASNTFGIDMDWLYVGGISSGGITASHTAMLDSTDVYSEAIASAISTHSPIYGITDTDTSIKIRGVLNYSGALHDASWIDAGDPSFISFHEDEDPTVPYKGGYARIFGQDIIYLNGSFVMDSAAKANGVFSELNTINSNTHVGYFFNAEKTTEVIDASALFMCNMICGETSDVEELEEIKPYNFGPNPCQNSIVFHLNGIGTIEILDLTGRSVLKQNINNSGVVNFSRVASGHYLMQIRIGEILFTEKVIKN
jgi:acetyl esterase/lipase